MEFKINKKSEFPIYHQLKEQIKFYLLSGALQPGARIPTPKDLGLYLSINRNTVIAAYKELEQEGLLVTKHGQGTYITEDLPSNPQGERKQALISLARETLEKTRELGFTPEDLFTVVFNRTVLGLDLSDNLSTTKDLRALMVECNMPDLLHYQNTLQTGLDIEIDGCLLDELPQKVDAEYLKNIVFVATNITHIEDVKAIMEPYNIEVFGVMVAPHLHMLMEIRNLPAGTRVGLVCITDQFAARMENGLINAGINHLILEHSGTEDLESFRRMLGKIDYLVSSRAVIDTIRPIVPKQIKILEFSLELDQTVIEMLKQYLVQKRGNGRTAGLPNFQ
jgi:DNA-binding transcriptional regulator YhcF (GntR family)